MIAPTSLCRPPPPLTEPTYGRPGSGRAQRGHKKDARWRAPGGSASGPGPAARPASGTRTTTSGRPTSRGSGHTREALTIAVARRIAADATVKALNRLVVERGRPSRFIRCDNGPELTAGALRAWCRFSDARISYIEPDAPGRTPTSGASAARCATSCLPQRPSTARSWPKCCSRTGGPSTTPSSGPTAPWLPDHDRLRQGLDHEPSRTLIADGSVNATDASRSRCSAVYPACS